MAPPAADKPPEKKVKKQPLKTKIDPYIGSRIVVGLTKYNFEEFLADKDAALVMFYDPAEVMCEWSKKHFLKAAKTTVRENHAFSALNCTIETELCQKEGYVTAPYFKLYSKGKPLADYSKPKEFIYHTMKKFVENAPLFEENKPPVRPC